MLVDTAVVGHLGARSSPAWPSAALLTNASWLCNFLAYGSTARASRLFGAGRRDEAVGGWAGHVAGARLGVVLARALQVLAEPAAG